MHTYKKSVLMVIGLILVTSAVLAYVGKKGSAGATGRALAGQGSDGLVSLRTRLVQDKVLTTSDGKVAVELSLAAADTTNVGDGPIQPVDLVVVLDRSGSMNGQKINDARKAIIQLLDRLTAKDRFALVCYANGMHTVSPLVPADDAHRRRLSAAVYRVRAQGGTNLGGGLRRGIDMLLETPSEGRQRKVILISDGLANQGITDPVALGNMAAVAGEHRFAISTVGVGLDFNEILMTTVADHGSGSYYFLEDPQAFAQVFEYEFQHTRNVAVAGLEIRVPLAKGVKLVHAGGYPVDVQEGYALIRPGDLLSGQQRKIFLTYRIFTDKEGRYTLESIQARYHHNGFAHAVETSRPLTVACVPDARAVLASIDKETWSSQVVQEEFNLLREEVAEAIRKGEKDEAQKRIQAYSVRNGAINASVGSAAVQKNLEQEVKALKESVEDTFAGSPAAVAAKQKQRAKALQYDSYQERRSK